jgi:hypothetical protein
VNTAGEAPTVDFILLKNNNNNNNNYYCTERSKSCTKGRLKKGGPSKANENKLSQRSRRRRKAVLLESQNLEA